MDAAIINSYEAIINKQKNEDHPSLPRMRLGPNVLDKEIIT